MSADAGHLQHVLHSVLQTLSANPYPHVPTPPGCKKRASVSIIIRIRPALTSLLDPSTSVVNVPESSSPPADLNSFFSQAWVQTGDPEVLFIKRAGRHGDRWSGHIALPGGKRDPEDHDDRSAAIRETREEVGLDLTHDCLYAGHLPERVVATIGGKALMVLCPYIFVLTTKSNPLVVPQPTEVASAHWVPLRALLSESLRTSEHVDTASRLAEPGGPVAQILLRSIVGRMIFSALQLAPSESIHASSIDGFIPSVSSTSATRILSKALALRPALHTLTSQQPLILWGLTLGIMADFLDMLPPYNAVRLWRYPTFSPPDLRFLVWLLTRDLRKNNAGQLSAGTWPYAKNVNNDTALDATSQAVPVNAANTSGTSTPRINDQIKHSNIDAVSSKPYHAIGKLLAGYYDRANLAIGIFVVYRTILSGATGWWLFKLWKRRRGLAH